MDNSVLDKPYSQYMALLSIIPQPKLLAGAVPESLYFQRPREMELAWGIRFAASMSSNKGIKKISQKASGVTFNHQQKESNHVQIANASDLNGVSLRSY